MAYSELIKNFGRIRGYMKEFYIYGFKTRSEYDKKSGRSYDNEKRRIESYLGDYMGFRQTSDGKNVFLSIDSRSAQANPLYKALKSKSFTDGDITLHFIIFDILHSPELKLSLNEITEKIHTDYLSKFKSETAYDDSTIRKKLKEYTELGVIKTEKHGRQMLYRRTPAVDISSFTDAVHFFSEVGGCGAVGSFISDKSVDCESCFSFKHHYITGALESEILCELFCAIRERKSIEITRTDSEHRAVVIPLKIYVSTQNGRQYLFGYNIHNRRIRSYRLDYIKQIKLCGRADNYNEAAELFERTKAHLWGVSLGDGRRTERVEFTVHIGSSEEHIYRRLLREKRLGTVTRIDESTCAFSAEVYDTAEMIPWIRTFICRLKSLDFSNRTVENQFKSDIEDMYRIYGIGGDE